MPNIGRFRSKHPPFNRWWKGHFVLIEMIAWGVLDLVLTRNYFSVLQSVVGSICTKYLRLEHQQPIPLMTHMDELLPMYFAIFNAIEFRLTEIVGKTCLSTIYHNQMLWWIIRCLEPEILISDFDYNISLTDSLSPVTTQAITGTNADLSSSRPPWVHLNYICFNIQTFLFTECIW